jgi:tetratricopeptide (TPR) repeat protein
MLSPRLHRRLRVLLAGAALFVLLALIGGAISRPLWADHHFRAAQQSLQRRDFAAAEAHLRACVARRGEDGPTHLLAARCARRAGRYEDAERHLARCRKEPGAALEATLLRVQRGQLGEDENYLKRTITPDHPDAPLVLEALALGYARTDRLASLMECTDLWLQVRPEDAQALYWRGYACERLRHTDKARDLYRRAVAADPTCDDARLRLGDLLVQRFNQPQEALDQFEQVRPRRPDDPAVLLGLARCYRLLDRAEEARQAIDALLARQPRSAEALTERGKLALAAGELSEAEASLRQAVALAGDDRDALYNFIQCLNRLGRDEEARACTARLATLEADLARMSVLIAEIGRDPNNPALRREAGQICLRHGREQEGLRWLHSALQVAPQDPETHAVLNAYHERQGSPDRAAVERGN